MSIWNEQTVAQLKSFISEDRSFREIAQIMGISRSAVAGASHRYFGGGGAIPSEAWTDDDRGRLRSLVEQNLTVREICARMQKGRNGVNKQLKKLGLKAKPAQFALNFGGQRKSGSLPPREVLEPITPLPFLALSLRDVSMRGCRYPHGDRPFFFCGQPAERGSYCEFHYDLTHEGVASASRNRPQPKNQANPRRPDHDQDAGGWGFRAEAERAEDDRSSSYNHAAGNRRGEMEDSTDDESGPLTFRKIGDIAAEIVERLA